MALSAQLRTRAAQQRSVLRDHLVGTGENCGGHGEAEPFRGFEVDDHSVRLKPGKGKEDVALGNLSTRSRGFDSLPVKVSQPAGSESCMGGGNTAREA